jgi:tetratricopeptide (TPR) repeat protein
MVLLAQNTLADISNTQKIAAAVVRVHHLDEKQLSGMLHAVPAEYPREQQKVEALLQHDPAQANRYLEDHDPLGRLTAVTISDIASKESVADFVQMLKTVQQNNPKAGLVSEYSINAVGYGLMDKKLYPQAIAVLRMNTETFVNSANAWDSLADAFSPSGDVLNALESYRKALKADATYSNADFAKKFIAEHAQK